VHAALHVIYEGGWAPAMRAIERPWLLALPCMKTYLLSIDVHIRGLGQHFRYVCGVSTVLYEIEYTLSAFYRLERLLCGLNGGSVLGR
jgi:hypothetical protein